MSDRWDALKASLPVMLNPTPYLELPESERTNIVETHNNAIATVELVMGEIEKAIPDQPQWRVFDKDDEGTWPEEQDHYWVCDGTPDNKIVSKAYWTGDPSYWKYGDGPTHWQPIEVPAPPV